MATGTITAVEVAGKSVTVSSAMAISLPSTTDMSAVSVKVTGTGTLAAAVGANDPTTITSGTAFSANLTSSGVITITATVDTAATYTLTITKGTFDDLQSVAIEDISNFGWSGARHISGDLDTYVSGGLAIPLGTFKPRFVINVMVTDGFVGYFDIASGKLKVYKSGSEATVNQLKNSSYDMILLG